MKRLLAVIVLLILISSPVFAFSVKDFLFNFREMFTGISGMDIAMFSPTCNQGDLRCNTGTECGGNPCVVQCQNNQWIEYSYCAEQCSSGQCVNNGDQLGDTMITNPSGDNEITISKCSDETAYNSCSNSKPLFCDNGNLVSNCNVCGCSVGESCSNNICIEDTGPYDPGGEDEDDPDVLNLLPIVIPLKQKIVKINQAIQFRIIATDPNKDALDYYFRNNLKETSSEKLACKISNDIVECVGLSPGNEILTLVISDGIDEAELEVSILIIRDLPGLKRGIAAGAGNTPPVAIAGDDKIGIAGQEIILDASLSYDSEGLLSVPETYRWYENNNILGSGKVIMRSFSTGTHTIRLLVTDSEGLTSEDAMTILIKEKIACKNTGTIYYPEDTLCNNKWPVKEGEEIKINSFEYSCSTFEVCSEEIDPIIEDSINCCSDNGIGSGNSACSFAIENSDTFKNCQALYVIKSLGPVEEYMSGYFDAEMCCKGVEGLCPDSSYLYTPQPIPPHLKGVRCSNTPDNNPNGYWASDTKLDLNEIALFDAPAHSSLNILKTGTCVDYSVSATTLLRKIGFTKNQALTVEASNHAYNLIRLDLDKKYTVFDMTGNNDGLVLGRVPSGYDYCANIINCYNDFGKVQCPSNKDIIGCENIKENLGRSTGTVGYQVTGAFKSLYNKIKEEILR